MNPCVAQAWPSIAPRPGPLFSTVVSCSDSWHNAAAQRTELDRGCWTYLAVGWAPCRPVSFSLLVLSVRCCLSHPAPLFEVDLELKLMARHEPLLCPGAPVGISRVLGRGTGRRRRKAMASHVPYLLEQAVWCPLGTGACHLFHAAT